MCKDGYGTIGSFAVRMYAAELSAPDDFFEVWYASMPPGRKERADRFRCEPDRKRCIMAYALLHHALCDLAADERYQNAFTVPEGYLPISEDEDRKPFFENIPVCFNISHSGERVAVALSPSEVGCDVEKKRTDAMKIAERFFSEDECAYLRSIPDRDERDEEFTKLWTLKESAVKCCGQGIRHVLSDFSVTGPTGIRHSRIKLPGFDEEYNLREYESDGGYCYSVCSPHDMIEEKIRHIPYSLMHMQGVKK